MDGEDRKCVACGNEGNTGHDLKWSEALDGWVHGELCEDLALMSAREVRLLARLLYQAATREDAGKQWVKNGAEGVFLDLAKIARRRHGQRRSRRPAQPPKLPEGQ
jgi:hypothetical protein